MSRAIPFFGDRLKIHLPVIFMSTTGSQGFVPQPNMIIYCIQTTRWSCSPRMCWNYLNCLVPETRVSHTDIPYLVLLYFCFDLKTSMSLNMCHVRVASNGLIAGPSQLRRKNPDGHDGILQVRWSSSLIRVWPQLRYSNGRNHKRIKQQFFTNY